MTYGEDYNGDERRAEQHVHVDSLPENASKSARRIQFELALTVTILLAIFSVLLKNSIDIATLQTEIHTHNATDDNRTAALAEGISNLTGNDDRILIQIERLLTQQEATSARLEHVESKMDRHIEKQVVN
jgi:hypothetical protein